MSREGSIATRVMDTPNNTKRTAGAQFTAAPIEPSTSGSIAPEFVRVPDCERLFGLKRGLLYALINDGAIKSVCLRKPGARTGVRLVSYQSVRDYLNRQLT